MAAAKELASGFGKPGFCGFCEALLDPSLEDADLRGGLAVRLGLEDREAGRDDADMAPMRWAMAGGANWMPWAARASRAWSASGLRGGAAEMTAVAGVRARAAMLREAAAVRGSKRAGRQGMSARSMVRAASRETACARCAVSEDRDGCAVCAGVLEGLVELGSEPGDNKGPANLAEAPPGGGAGLEIKVDDDGGLVACLLEGDGSVDGERGLAGVALLGNEGECMHACSHARGQGLREAGDAGTAHSGDFLGRKSGLARCSCSWTRR